MSLNHSGESGGEVRSLGSSKASSMLETQQIEVKFEFSRRNSADTDSIEVKKSIYSRAGEEWKPFGE